MKNFIINQSLNHPKRTIFLSILLTIIISLGIRFVTIDDDLMKLIPEDIPSRQLWDEIEEDFGSTDFTYIAVGKKGEDALNPSLLSKLYDVSMALERLPEVEEVISLATQKKIVSDDGFMLVDDLIPSRQLSAENISDIRDYLADNELIKKRNLSENGEYINILIRPAANVVLADFATAITKITSPIFLDYEVHYGGTSYLSGEVPIIMMEDLTVLMRAAIILMILLLYVNLRSFPGLIMILLTIIFSAGAMMGSLGWLYYLSGNSSHYIFSLLNSSMPIIILTITNSYGVHVLTHFFRAMRENKDKKLAVRTTMDSLILPIFMAALTTIIAFLTLLFAPISPMMGYGVSISIGISWGFLLSTLFIPSLIMVFPWKENSRALNHKSIMEKVINRFSRHVLSYPRKYFTFGLLVVVASIYGITLINVEVNTMDFFKKDYSIRKSVDFLDEYMTGSMNLAMKIEGDLMDPKLLKQLDKLQTYIEEDPNVTLSISIVDIIKQMHRVVMDDDPLYETIPDSVAKVNNLFTLYSMSGDPDDFSSLIDYDYENALAMVQMKNISTKDIILMLADIERYIEKNIDTDAMHIELTGMMVFLKDFAALVTTSSIISIVSSIILIFFVAWFFFKHFSWGLVAILPLLGAVLLNFGLMGYFKINMNHVISLLTSIIIGVGVDFAVHYVARFRYFVRKDPTAEDISFKTAQDVGYPIALDVVSNLGFAALLFSVLRPLNYMGGLSLFAMFSSSFGTLILLATAIELFKKPLIDIIQKEK